MINFSRYVKCIFIRIIGNLFPDSRWTNSYQVHITKKALGIIMAFGAGTLISAVSYELIYEAVKIAGRTGFPTMGAFAGAFTFFLSDKHIEKFGSKNRMDVETSHSSSLVVPMLPGIILDGIPESYEHGEK